MIVAVDGTAASGKGTLVAKLAKYFNLASLDTGLLYRSVAFSMIKAGDNLKDQEKAAKHATSIDYRLIDSPNIILLTSLFLKSSTFLTILSY